MCGRLAQYTPVEELAELLAANAHLQLMPRYNLGPTLDLAACRLNTEGQRELVALRWGLVPHWTRSDSGGPAKRYSMFNARADTVHQKPAYRDSFRQRRCLIPADGFYEWQRSAQGKQPYYFRLEQQTPLVMAGLWDRWQGESATIESTTIITTDANDLMRPVHDRMPVILPPEAWDLWLDPDQRTEQLQELLQPYQAEDLLKYPVSKAVNNGRNDMAELIRPIE